MNEKKNTLNCPVCGSAETSKFQEYKNTSEVFSGLYLSYCNNCSMVYASPMPNDDLLEKYNAAYFLSAHGGQPADIMSLSFFKAIAKVRLAYIIKYLQLHDITVSSILEIGPGPGFFAEAFIEHFPGIEYLAMESDISCYASLQKLGVKILDAKSLDSRIQGSIDLVIMSHILEHVSDPKAFLNYVTAKLAPGGALFIEVPCTDYLHKSLIEPHLLFFDKDSMNYLLKELLFTEIQLSYHGEKIEDLKRRSFGKKLYRQLRYRLIAMGFVKPFARREAGMELITNPLEKAVIVPYMAHKESKIPAWWLRSIARKK